MTRFYIHFADQTYPSFCKAYDLSRLPDDATVADAVLVFCHAAVAKHGPDHPLWLAAECLERAVRDDPGNLQDISQTVQVIDDESCVLHLREPLSRHISEGHQDLTVILRGDRLPDGRDLARQRARMVGTQLEAIARSQRVRTELAGPVEASTSGSSSDNEKGHEARAPALQGPTRQMPGGVSGMKGVGAAHRHPAPRHQSNRAAGWKERADEGADVATLGVDSFAWSADQARAVHITPLQRLASSDPALPSSGRLRGGTSAGSAKHKAALLRVPEGSDGPADGGDGHHDRSPAADLPSKERDEGGNKSGSLLAEVLAALGMPLNLLSDAATRAEGVERLLGVGTEAISAKQPRRALAAFSAILQSALDDARALEGIVRVWLEAGRTQRAWDCAETALEAHPGSLPLFVARAECLHAMGRHRQAARDLEEALERLRLQGTVSAAPVGLRGPLRETDLHVAYVRAIRAAGAPAAAVSHVVMSVVNSDTQHVDGLIEYGRLALGKGLVAQAVQVALKALVLAPKSADVKAFLAECLEREGGIAGVRATVDGDGGMQAAAALAFVATAAKDPGAVDAAVELMRDAASIAPGVPAYALALMHTLEAQFRYTEAIRAAHAMLLHLPGLRVLGQDVGALREQVEEILGEIDGGEVLAPPITPALAAAACRRVAAAQSLLDEERVLDGLSSIRVSSGLGGSGAGAGDAREGAETSREVLEVLAAVQTCVKILYMCGWLDWAAKLVPSAERMRGAAGAQLHTTHIRNEAAYQACVTRLLANHRFDTDSLLTVARALEDTTTEDQRQPGGPGPGSESQRSPRDPPIVLIVGDSHIVPYAYRAIETRDGPKVLIPLLVTGSKVWHLRPQSRFYPKHNFWQAMRLVAPGRACPELGLPAMSSGQGDARGAESTPERHDAATLFRGRSVPWEPWRTPPVMFLHGEIDCREGILRAVDRLKYDSFPEALLATVGIYQALLQELAHRQGLRVLVHPVPPVLDDTRGIVLCFNHALRQALSSYPEAGVPIQFLNMHWRLLSVRGADGDVDEGGASMGGGSVGGRPLADVLMDQRVMDALARDIDEGRLWGSGQSVDVRALLLQEGLDLDGTHLTPKALGALAACLDDVLCRGGVAR